MRDWIDADLRQWIVICGIWSCMGIGFVSSNDGSHTALARALLRFPDLRLHDDLALTLGVDYARVGNDAYSDRPPGTAALALPMVWVGKAFDPVLLETAQRRQKLWWMPARWPYLRTYAKRFPKSAVLASRQGTAMAVTLQSIVTGIVGLWGLRKWLSLFNVPSSTRRQAIWMCALGTLWGPYATMLFSHASTLACLLWMHVAVTHHRLHATRWRAWWAGVWGAWAIACDYSLVIWTPLFLAIRMDWRAWGWTMLGALPVIGMTAAYHRLAFGSIWSTGYAYHATFQFTHSTSGIFGGDVYAGLHALLWGLDTGSLLALSPIVVVIGTAAVCLGVAQRLGRRLEFSTWLDRSFLRETAIAFVCSLPWAALMLLHRTPAGGHAQDYRYWTPLLLFVGPAWAIVCAWQAGRYRPWLGAGFALLLVYSTWRGWSHVLERVEAKWGASWDVALVIVLLICVFALLGHWVRRFPFRRSPA